MSHTGTTVVNKGILTFLISWNKLTNAGKFYLLPCLLLHVFSFQDHWGALHYLLGSKAMEISLKQPTSGPLGKSNYKTWAGLMSPNEALGMCSVLVSFSCQLNTT